MAAFFLAPRAAYFKTPRAVAYLTRTVPAHRGKEVSPTPGALPSSKVPASSPAVDDGTGCSGPGYLDCWNRYWAWTKTPAFKQEMRKIVLADDFLDGNYLSTELRVPVTLLQTNACSPLATNALEGNIWDNFSSRTYTDLPRSGHPGPDPFTGGAAVPMPPAACGYTRPAHCSASGHRPLPAQHPVGTFNPTLVEVDGSFEDSIGQMLWAVARQKDSQLGTVHGLSIARRIPSTTRLPPAICPILRIEGAVLAA